MKYEVGLYSVATRSVSGSECFPESPCLPFVEQAPAMMAVISATAGRMVELRFNWLGSNIQSGRRVNRW